jgi:hypothetical protein
MLANNNTFLAKSTGASIIQIKIENTVSNFLPSYYDIHQLFCRTCNDVFNKCQIFLFSIYKFQNKFLEKLLNKIHKN